MNRALQDLATVEYGKSPNEVRDVQGKYPVYGTGGLVGFANDKLFDKEGVIVARKGTLDKPTYVEGEYWVIDTAYATLAKDDVYPKWLYYCLDNYDLAKLNEATGVPSISRDYLYRIEFHTPEYSEQKKIAKILTTVDNLIEKTQALIDKYTAIKQGMMADLFTRGIDLSGTPDTNPNHGQLRPPVEQAPELYKQTKLGWVPKEWEVVLMDSYATRGSGHTPSKSFPEYWNGGVKWVSLADSRKLDNLYIYKTDKEVSDLGLANSSATKHPEGTVILSRDAGIGKSAILGDVMAVSQHFMAWRCGKNADRYFLYFWLQYMKPSFENIAMGSTIPTIGLEYFKRLKIAVPSSVGEQSLIGAQLLSLHNNICKYRSELIKYREVKKGLMQDLLTGKVRVN